MRADDPVAAQMARNMHCNDRVPEPQLAVPMMRRAAIVLVGETPGDEKDKTGYPFIGPAGALLDQALETAGISRQEVYVTKRDTVVRRARPPVMAHDPLE